jgi:hypothetical protein
MPLQNPRAALAPDDAFFRETVAERDPELSAALR